MGRADHITAVGTIREVADEGRRIFRKKQASCPDIDAGRKEKAGEVSWMAGLHVPER